MSAELLDGAANFRHSIKDDMESLFYVVLYCCVRWLPHNKVDSLDDEGTLHQRLYTQQCAYPVLDHYYLQLPLSPFDSDT
ncbi:hypothetical protein DFH11DRAFT_1586639 [Phellopilus nigrolimitatus]|nr:hypothetical protein DFH11DRAFT_1586639 [Phellopilus nigrolimitatus]